MSIASSAVLAAGPVLGAPSVELVKQPVATIRLKDYEPAKSAEGATRWYFHCAPEFDCGTTCGGKVIKHVRMKIGLTVEESLPHRGEQRLIDHENGHVEIANQIYAKADSSAKAAAQRSVGRKFDSTDSAARFVCTYYTAATAKRCQLVQAAYDQLTAHGAKAVDTKKAIQRAFLSVP